MRIAIGADHAGFRLKEVLRKHLRKRGHEVLDYGTDSEDSVDYPVFAGGAARAVASKDADLGILVCWTGIGMCIAANKVKGVRAALCRDAETARLSRQHNDANVLCMGSKVTKGEVAIKILEAWLSADFEGGRHQKRVDMISSMEK